MKPKPASQIAWYPNQEQKIKIEKLKKALFIKNNSDLIRRAIAELYSRTVPNGSWE
ncbi:MAG: hypothetical protein PHV59_06860 [Victivallales bacterium]|nr:hypothetical protein [Victivallales bacterium]